jgi:general stress protein 26
MDMLSRPEFVDFVRHARLAVLATVSTAGGPEAALMEVAVTSSAELIFDTPFDARKIENIRKNDRVAIVVGWQAGISIQVEGTVRIVADNERAYYEERYLAEWPNARSMDRSLEVLVVTPEWVSLYDVTTKPPQRRYGIWTQGAL